MDRKRFIEICDCKIKLIRSEYSLSQEKMAVILGISKKTLVEIEKGRSSLGWTGSVALCMIFGNSEIITDVFGGKHNAIIQKIAFEDNKAHPQKTSGNKILWQTIKQGENYCIQQNVISQHYRLLDSAGNRIASSFNLEDLNIDEKLDK